MSNKLAAALRAVGNEQRSLYSAKTGILLLAALISLHIKSPGLCCYTDRTSSPGVACGVCHIRPQAFYSVAPVRPSRALLFCPLGLQFLPTTLPVLLKYQLAGDRGKS